MLKKALIPFLIAVSLVFLIFTRFLYLREFPVGILNDEVDVSLSAKNYFNNGVDLSGVSFPKSLFITNTWAGLSGLPSYLLAPFYGPLNLSPLVIRIPYVILSIFIGFLISLIVYEISKNKKLAVISIFVSLINPWLYFYSRQPTEAPFALFFVLIGVYLYVKFRGLRKIYSLPFFLFSFYSYFGAKPVIPILVILLPFVYGINLKNKMKWLNIFLIIFSILMTVTYFSVSIRLNGSTLSQRANQVTFLNFQKYADQVNQNRRVSVDFPFKELFYNKFTIFSKITTSKFFGQFSPEYLFISGDSVVPFSDHGVLYVLDCLIIIFSLYAFAISKEKSGKTLLILSLLFLIAGSVGSSISVVGNQFVFRSFLHIPAYIILISYGIYKLNKMKLIIPLYLFFYINFLVFFLFRYSIDQQDNHFISERVLSNYLIRLNKTDKDIIVIDPEPDRTYYQYIFYSGDNLNTESKIEFLEICPEKHTEEVLIINSKLNCDYKDSEYIVIQSQKDAGVRYKIYNDSLCNISDLTSYRRDHKITDYNIEGLNDKIFCNRWIQNGKTN